MYLSRALADGSRQAVSTIDFCYTQRKVLLLLYLLISSPYMSMAQGTHPTFVRGPSTGLVTKEIPNLLLTDHRTISQLVYVDLDIEKELQKVFSLVDIHDVTVLVWYSNHVERTKETIRGILEQAEKTLINQQPATLRPKRAIGGIVMGVMALLTVVGVVVGSTMNAVNSVSIKAVEKKNEELQSALHDIQRSLAIQHATNDKLVKIIKDTIVVASLQTERLDHSMRLHEEISLKQDLFYSFVEPVLFFTNNYLRQVELSVNNLLRAYIPLYLVDVLLVRQALSSLHGPDLDPTQIRIAFEAGTAIPMLIDVNRLHISFLLNIPLVRLDKIYQLKKVLNVGTWEGGMKTKIKSPDLVAYQNTSEMYFIPDLQTCNVFKDFNYLCPGNPFTPVKRGFLCGLEDTSSDSTLCDVEVTRPTGILTEVVLIDNMWLVSTNAMNMTVSYTKHGTFVVKPIPFSTFTTIVPKDVIITIDTENLFYISTANLEGGMEFVNTFIHFSIPHNPDLDFLLDKKSSHSLQLLLNHDNISISDLNLSSADSSYLTAEPPLEKVAQVVWCGLATIWMGALSIIAVYHHKYYRVIANGRCPIHGVTQLDIV